jgi:PAS domain-containing protein
MSGGFKRRRRRTGSTSRRYRPSQLVPIESRAHRAVGTDELLACGGVAIVAILLIALVWIVTGRAVQEQRAEIKDRAERAVSAQAATLAEEIRHELLLVDQSLTILQAAWKADSKSFQLADWAKSMPALTAVSDDIFIADAQRMIVQDTLPQAVGQGVGAAYLNFPHGSLEHFESDGTQDREAGLRSAEAGPPIDARRFLMYVVRPLDHPEHWLIGASYRSSELTRLFADASLGINGVVAMIDTRRGVIQAIAGPSARRLKVGIAKSEMFQAFEKNDSGVWLGDTAMDGVERIHGFRHVPGRDIVVTVGMVWSQAMAPAQSLAAGAHAIAFVASGLILVIGGLVLWELYTLRTNSRRQRRSERSQAALDAANADLATVRRRAELGAAQVRGMLESASDGIVLLDGDLRLALWNQRFAGAAGVEQPVLRAGLPLDELLRQQARSGLFGAVADAEVEVARRVALLRAGDSSEPLGQIGPNGESLVVRGHLIADGGVVVTVGGSFHLPPAPLPSAQESDSRLADVEEASGPVAGAIEW